MYDNISFVVAHKLDKTSFIGMFMVHIIQKLNEKSVGAYFLLAISV